ncbi:non-ribosomal peptide synthetase [Pseudomonas cerasi]|uniref:Amino acid adenylation n=1 Tax=Pseudomonas cerasi TaxID=1583341 RepID=A0A2K4VAX9_9PSED|nr:non-ribosomal peptide synthetase [Pseudomonas cerasi]SOS20803.1 amino acid adenylation [Pseudomonas cerasi]
MSINELLATLKAHEIHLTVKDGQLVVQGNRRALTENGLLEHLREHKPALIELIEQGDYQNGKRGAPALPANGIEQGCELITPAMVTLVDLDQAAIDLLMDAIPGDAANVQDIYPLAPLQQGILYHHVTATQGDPYVMQVQFAFSDQARLNAFAEALQTVITRHDILRTSVHWKGLETPVQVVWRHAELKVDRSPLAADLTMDLGQAPLMRLVCHAPAAGQRVEATLLFHHIAMDHSALEVVRHEIQACLSGQAEMLGVPVPFRNYVGQALLGVSEAQHEAFFREMLGDLDEPTLAYGLQDLSGEGDAIEEHSVTLDQQLCQRLRAQSRTLGISVASLFHLGWARVLAGLAGQSRVVFGTVLMGRLLGAEATERALGIFINTLPLRLDLAEQGVQAAVRATHQRLTALMRHEHAPLALAQRCSGVKAPTPLFNALLNYRHSAPAQASGETWQGIEVLQAQERSNYPLVLSVDDLGEAFGLTAQATAGIDPQSICAYMQWTMESVVDALEQTPQMPVEQLDIVPASERARLLLDFNDRRADYERRLTIHQRIEQLAEQQPDAIAAQVGAQHLSYRELNARANALADHLLSLGVQPDDRVAVVARRSLETLVGLLAVLKAGAGYVPVDPAHPDERIAYLLGDSAPFAVLAQPAFVERLQGMGLAGLNTPLIELDLANWPEQQDNPHIATLDATHLAYVIYTSGSTGQPKGVMVEHRTLNNLIDWHREAFDLHAGSHTASVAGFGFDAMAWEIWPALCAGTTLHLPPAEIGNEQLDALLDWWIAQPLQVAFLPTPVAEYAFSRNLRHPTLRTLLIGGDRLRQFHRDPGFAVINNYGPTETTVVATSGRLLPDGSLDIGKPVANTSIYLLDERQQLVPLGVPGELYIGGDSVARGYLNQPQLTAERFMHDPFAGQPQARMYRTGDLARWNADGTLEYLGRNDDQVKIRGVRIELGEIENQFSQLPGIEEALLLAREDEPGQPRLVGYFTERAGAVASSVEQLRTALLARLPGYMVPGALVRLDSWPLTANGKVDRRALPVPDRAALSTGEYQAPQGDLESALALIWSELLQVERIGRHDRFFELGGHSLLAMRMVSQVRQRLSLELALGDLFADSSLIAVAHCLTAAARSQLPAIEVQPRNGPVPLSSAQQRIWFMAQMEDANSAYNISLGLKLSGPLDSRALTRALERIVARHDSLRSRFSQEDDNAWVQAAPVNEVPVISLDDDLQDESVCNPQVLVKPGNLAYVIYTSGSTGKPKGVMIEHRNVARLFSATEAWFGFNQQDVWALFHSFAFDFSVWEIWGALLHGGHLVIVPQLVSRSPEDFYTLLCRAGVTVLNQTPSAFRQLIAAQGENGQAHALRKVIFGGEALDTVILKPWYARNVNAGTQLVNMYGITETTVHVTYYPLQPEDAQRLGASPIGRRIPDLQLYVLDARGEPVPMGVVGELYVGGAGVARGYLNREALTTERFLDNPFSHAPDARMYRTGDLARWLADGSLEYMGRNDEQVKIRGFRIELGEIAARLNDHPDVLDAVVVAREDVPGDKRLVGYYTSGEGKPGLDIEQLRAWLSGLLPDYMVPAAYVRLASLPVTANGKLDRKSLPAPDCDSIASRAYEAPQGAIEIALASLWAELLHVEQVGRQDNFFELGGHSLLAVTLIARMRRLDMRADIRVLFVQPTLAALAAAVGCDTEINVPANLIDAHCQRITPELLPLVALDQPAIDRIVARVPGGAANVQDIYPLGPLQTGILYHHLTAVDRDPYLLQPQFAFADASRLDAFCHALQRVIERNDILRTGLFWEGLQAPVQVVWRQAPLRVEETALQDLFNAPRVDLTQAPLLQLVYAHDPANKRIAAVLRYHHVIMDHIGLDILSHELQAILLDNEAQLAAPVPYRNYIAHVVQGPGDDAHEAFFREQLGDIDEPTLPYGLVTASAEQIPGEARLTLDGGLCRQVRDQARQLGVSAATLMHLAWAKVLGQLSGRDSVVFGTVLLGRLRGGEGGEGGERALGVFINTLPLRMDLGGHCARSAVLDLHGRLVGMLAHEHAQLALTQRCSALPAGAPLFNTLLNYRHSAVPEVDDQANNTAWQGIEVVHAEERSNYPLTLSIDDFGDGFSLTAQAAPGIDPQRICAYVQQALVHLVQALEQQSAAALIESSVVPEAERERLSVTFNDTRRDYPREQPVHLLLERRAALHPHAVAAVHGRRSLTYGELNERANHLAHYLLGQGVRPNEHVAILLPRSLELLISQLAICKCAATYVPLDVNAPAERQHYMLDDCQAKCVLTQSATSMGSTVQRIDLDRLNLDDQPAHDPGLPQASDTAAYVMYTSGSTGAPKGVRVAHRGIARLVLNNGYADFNEQDSIAFASNPAFDASTMEVWGALLNGGQLLVIEHTTLIDPTRFSAALRQGNVSVLFLTSALFNQYVQLIPEALAGLRLLLSGGERADTASFRTLLAQAPGLHLLNVYGPTETTTFATASDVRTLDDNAESIPIGRPIGNTTVYVLDAHQHLTPLGAIGELYIGGDGVALGYLNRPDLTAEKFIADPFSDQPGAVMYRTGDLGRWLEGGQLECLGRNDDQVKIRGFRIELGEIVNCLHQLPGIREAVVLAREDEPGNVRLVAYFTSRLDTEAPAPEQMRAHLQANLPEYMVPGAFVELTALPLTANGKLDSRALPKPDHSSLLGLAYEPPQGEIEIALAQIWAEVLQLERVGRHDHFFDLGGHSLLAMRMVSQVRQQMGMELPLGELFALGELAAVASALAGTGRSELSLILPAPRDQSLPLSFAQQRLWFLAQMEGGNQAYNIPLALSLQGSLDVAALTAALGRIVERHETLRSRFIAREEGAEVVFTSPTAMSFLPIEDLRQHPHTLTERVVTEATAAFDLTRGPLIRGCLLQVEDERHVLLLTVHHIVSDGWSMGVLTRELLALYPALRRGEADPLPALSIQYADYAVWQQGWMSGERLQHQAAYWRQALEGAPTLLTLPADRPRPAQQDFAGASLNVRLDGQLTAGLRALAQRQGVTLYMTLLTAWGALLSRLSGQAEVVIGSPIAGRGRAELEGLIGLFVNTLAIRIDTASAPTGEALLAQVRTRVLEAQDHQDLPFEQVVEIVRPTRSLAHGPLFQTTLNWLAGETTLPEMDGLLLATVEQQSQVSKFDLSLNLGEQGDALFGTLDYATALFDEATVQRYCGYFEQLLRTLVNNQQVVLADIPLVGQQEREYLLESLNASAVNLPQGQTIHALIEARAEGTPETVAARFGEQSLSYAQMNRQANSLAHHLIRLGVRPDDRVAVVARRGLDTLVSLLAVLKSGACYVPVDPAHPDERISYLLTDSAPAVVLAEQAFMARLPALTVPLLALDRPQWPEQPANPLVSGLTPGDLAYVIYTSGSTGQPKGVMVEHRTLADLVHWHCQAFALHAGSHTATVAGFGFDAMAWEVWPALCAGATLHIPPAEISNEQLDLLLDWWLTQPLHVAFLPTPVAEYAFSRELYHPTLRTLLIGGDRLRQFHREPGFAVINNYGPTETTVVATSGRLLPDGSLDIGKPIANTRVYLLDEHQQLVPTGVAGELYIGGEGVARGYLNQPQLTAERFLSDPFCEHPQARMYRTGDLARWNADGTLDYLGRNDDQVKIRGMRIELGEIEAQLTSLPGIEESLVVAREDEPGQSRLVAYFIEQGPRPALDIARLRADMLDRLPGYMVPSAFVRLDAWPLTANGKVDRRALPVPDRDAMPGREYEPPQGELEMALADIWSELLQVEQIGRNDHFFELGGHSLLAVTLIARMRRRGMDADIRVLFAQPTLAALARAVGSGAQVKIPANLIGVDCTSITPDLLPLVKLDQAGIDRIVASVTGGASNIQDIYPLGPLQAGIFYHYLSAAEDDPYRLQARFAFADRSRLDAFSQALQQVIARNDVLRTSLCWEGLETPVQVVWRHADLPVIEVPLAALDTPEPLELVRAPLLRLVHADDPENGRIVAVLLFHHLIMDHVALDLLSQELQAVLLDQAAQLPAPVPYRNYIAQTLLGAGDDTHEAFFREQLGDLDEPTLAYAQTWLPGPEVAGEARVRLDADLSRRLRHQVRQLGVSPASLMHLAWAQVLGRLSGRDSVVFGTVLLGRLNGSEGAERTLGVFINTLPLRIDLADQSARDALSQTHRRLTGLLAHEQASLAIAQRCSALPAGVPLFSALLNYRHSAVPSEVNEAAGEAWQGIELLQSGERSSYPLTLSVDDLGEAFDLTALTSTGIDARRICAYLSSAVNGLVDALEQSPAEPIQTLNILPGTERAELLDGFNADRLTAEYPLPVHLRIEQQALDQPNALAAQAGDQHLSYGELNARANALAHHLIGLGVRPDDRVAVVARRGLETLTGLLAVLKAGASYVPVDPAHPDERISYLLENSAPVVALAQFDLLTRLPELQVPVIALDRPDWSQRTDNPSVPEMTTHHLAYVIYTSGSTGLPKGVMVEHRTLNNLVDWHCEAFNLRAGSHTASVAGFGFDAMAWEVWPALCAGAVLHLPPAEIGNEQLDVLLDWWLAQPLQVAFLPTPVAEYAFSRELHHPTLQTLLIGGDRLRHFNRDPGFAVVNNYGPTETTVVASSGRMQPGKVLHIGKPVSHARLYVLDSRGQPVPLGVPGELYIGGTGVARGYLNRADLTAERFLDDPFSDSPGARMYRSGDLVRWLSDGTLEYLGRNDDQVKIRGVRIEPGEIEQHLAQCPGVGEAVVTTQRLDDGSLRLVGYFTRRDASLDSAALRAHLLGQLPEYMVPAVFVGLDTLPLTQNGKVDRKALPAPDLAALANLAYQAPSTALEERLAEVWAEVLEVGKIGRHDSFFELGGHSLSAIRLVSLLQKAGVSLTLAELFQHPSVAALAGLLDQRPGSPDEAREVITVRAGGSESPLFLLHDFTGLDAYFPVLGQHLQGDFPIYGLPGIGLGQQQLRTMECLAARMVERIRQVQPRGPYRLAGWSFGGVLAYEVATQLLGMDEAVTFLGLIDSYVPRLTDQGKARWQGPDLLERQLLSHCTAHWQAQAGEGAARLARLTSLSEQAPLPDFATLLQLCRDEGLLYEELALASDQQLHHYLDREVAHGQALAHYQLEPLSLPIHLFRAEQRPMAPIGSSSTLGWGEILSRNQLQCVDVPGDHMTMMQAPHVAVLGLSIVQALHSVPATPPPAPAHQSLLAIQSGRDGHAPVFCVPGAGDSVTSFIGLAEALGPDWPIHGLQPRGLDGRSVPHSRVEAAAQSHVQAIEALYPKGPLHLVGHSFGGWAAHAMAVKLQAQGREVVSLTLIDSEAPGGEGLSSKPYTATAVLERLIEALQLSSGRSLELDPMAFADSDTVAQMHLLQQAMVRVGLLPPRLAAQALQGIVRTFASALRTVYRPEPGGYSGRASLVLVNDPHLDALDNQLEHAACASQWQHLLPQLSLWEGPGNHFSVLKAPDVYSLAAWWYDGLTVGVGETQ